MRLFLLKDDNEELYDCEMRWQSEDAAGLMFIDACTRAKRKTIMEKCMDAVVLEPLMPLISDNPTIAVAEAGIPQ